MNQFNHQRLHGGGVPNTPVTYWIYWDIHVSSARKTYGFTFLEPKIDRNGPIDPEVDQHWFDLNSNIMKVWNGRSWIEKIRVFAAKVEQGGIIVPYEEGVSQVHIYCENEAGVIFSDISKTPIKKNSNGTFLTTVDQLLTEMSVAYAANIETYTAYGIADESIAKYSVVKRVNSSDTEIETAYGLARFEDVSDNLLAMSVTSGIAGDSVSVMFEGLITNTAWNWIPSKRIWVDLNGELTQINPSDVDPSRGYQNPVAKAVTSQTILFSPNSGMGNSIVVYSNGGGGTGVDASVVNKGVVKLSVEPSDATNPIAVGTNDPRLTDSRVPLEHFHEANSVSLSAIVGLSSENVQDALAEIENQIVNITVGGLGYVPVNKAGDTMDGPLNLSRTPQNSMEAATKQYVDDNISGLTPNHMLFTQSTSAATWTFAHNLGYYPTIMVLDNLKNQITPDVKHIDINTIQILHSSPTIGYVVI